MKFKKTALVLLNVIIIAAALASAAMAHPFTDVPADSYYNDSVQWAIDNGVTLGATDTTFEPYSTCTRGQVVTFIWRAKGKPEPSNSNPFTDIDASNPFYKAILWAYQNGITAGATDATFEPDATCTNAQVVTFLWRANGKPSAKASNTVAASYSSDLYYKEAVAWADSNGLLSGVGGAFVPEADSPRANIVTYLYRYASGTVSETKDGTVLYTYKVKDFTYKPDGAHIDPNSTQGWARTNYLNNVKSSAFQVLRIYNNRNSGGGLPIGETMTIDFPSMPDIATSNINAAHLSFKYCYVSNDGDVNVGYTDRLEVYVSTDNKKTWKKATAGLIAQDLLGSITTSDGRVGVLFEVTTDDLVSLVDKGEIITDVRLKPYGDYPVTQAAFRLASVTVTAYDKPLTESLMKAPSYIPISGDTLREIAVAQIKKVTAYEWVSDKEINTMNYSSVGGVTTDLPMKYYAGYLHKGPLYTRVVAGSAEKVLSSIVDGKYVGGYTPNDAVGMDCSRIVIDAISRFSSGNKNYLISQMLCDIINTPLVEPLSNKDGYTDTSKLVASVKEKELYSNYANSHIGDLAISCPDNVHIRLITSEPVVVYRNNGTIDPNNSYILMTESGGTSYYYWKTPGGNTVRVKEDPAVYKKSNPTHTFLYGASCRVDEKYTFMQLKNSNYVIATLEEYHSNRIEELDVTAKLIGDAGDIAEKGFNLIIQSNYRIIDVGAVLTDKYGNVVYENTEFCSATDFDIVYNDNGLNSALSKLSKGSYKIAVNATTGPVMTVGGEVPNNCIYEIEILV